MWYLYIIVLCMPYGIIMYCLSYYSILLFSIIMYCIVWHCIVFDGTMVYCITFAFYDCILKYCLVLHVLYIVIYCTWGVIQMCTFTFTFLKASKVIIDFQYFTNNILSQFWWRFPILHKPFFLFGTESTMWLRKLKGWLVGVWDGTNLGWIPTGNLLSQFHPKIPMIRRCSTILPTSFHFLSSLFSLFPSSS